MDGPGPALNARRAAALIAAALLVATAARAEAEGCAPAGDAAAAPLPGGTTTFNPADFGNVPEICPAGEASLRLRGELVDASGAPDFFGRLVGSATFRVRRPVTRWTWLALSIDLLDERYVNDAGLAASGASFGPASIGFHWTAVVRERGALAVHARALLPIDTARQLGVEAGLELGAAGRLVLPRRFAVDGGVTLAAPVDFVAGQAHGQLRPTLLAEGWWSRSPRLALAAGVSATLAAAPETALKLLVPRVALRTGLRHRLWLAFLAETPVAGTDRTNLIASAFLGWTP
ncbi:MAG TPA: hypothetical protein VLT58_00345 [Polyangia bacterium]|nr:hypothetical protein [Polyangia bacterium]